MTQARQPRRCNKTTEAAINKETLSMNGLQIIRTRFILPCIMGLLILSSTGCSLYRSMEGPMAISAMRVPQEFLGHPKSEMVDISYTTKSRCTRSLSVGC